MNERLLQFIWQFQYLNAGYLTTTESEVIHIIYPGTYNTNQGPDFLDAKIKIGDTTWAGNIELHVFSSDWELHGHSRDPNYNNIILHVVWKDNVTLKNAIPVLELFERVPKILLHHYSELMAATVFIPCENSISEIKKITLTAWKERLVVERLQHKTELIFGFQKSNNNHWEETFWWFIAKNFGAKVNMAVFEALARSIPINILAKHKQQILQIEAILFGQAGLLNTEFNEAYPKLLQREYRFLQSKYQLRSIHKPVYFLRMRPANFPSVRLAQLSMLVHQSLHLFATIKEAVSLKAVRALLNVTANDYWHYHYVFDEETPFFPKKLGQQMTDNILINTVVPMLFAYGHYHNDEGYKNKALQWLMDIKAEKNSITAGFIPLGIIQKNALDSQALIQLKNEYCSKKRCLDCTIGNAILKQ